MSFMQQCDGVIGYLCIPFVTAPVYGDRPIRRWRRDDGPIHNYLDRNEDRDEDKRARDWEELGQGRKRERQQREEGVGVRQSTANDLASGWKRRRLINRTATR